MKLIKKILFITAVICCCSSVFAQKKEKETSVENEYLNDVDGDIIMGLANADDLDSKLVALQYLQDALDNGNTSETIIQALDQLAGEGLINPARANGRLVNNFPEVRRQACLLMAKVKTEHSVNTLISIAIADNEPMVVAAAVKSLGEIGINENDETVAAIAFANKRNQYLNPTSSLAMEVLDAYEKLAPNTENKRLMVDSITGISSNYRYVTVVRQKALKVLKNISSSGSNKNAK
ncbi:MAG: HEAT repeat domain-containing protein [Treponema sp.]|nr:HEAT repeat domain-containing protein [Treponema sp.]